MSLIKYLKCYYILPALMSSSLLISSCTDNQVDADLFKDKELSVQSTDVKTDSVYMRYPFRIKKLGDKLLISDLHGSEHYCYQFSYPQMQLQQAFAVRGQGPSEFLDLENIRFNSKGEAITLDANKSMLTIFDTTNSQPSKQIKLDQDLIRTLDFDCLNDSSFIVPDYSGKNRLCIINNQGQIIDRLFSIPTRTEQNNQSKMALSQAWRSFIDYNPTNGILAMASQLGHVLEIYNVHRKHILKIVYGAHGEPKFIDKGAYAVPTGIMGYSDVQVGQNRIYALFWGRSFNEIRNNTAVTEGGNMLEVFDLQGNPIRRYMLDKYITGFCIDEKDNTMFALDINSNQYIVTYKL